MRESVIRQFFEGHATAADLATDAEGAFERRVDGAGTVFSRLHATPMEGKLEVTPAHVIGLIDAVLDGTIDLDALDAIAFCLEASDTFSWDVDTEAGDRVSRALFLLGSPEVNFPLTPILLGKVRHLLLTGEETFDVSDHRPRGQRPQLLSERSWQRDPGV